MISSIQHQQFGHFGSFGGRGGRGGGEGGHNNSHIGGGFDDKDAFEQVGETDMICHYCKEKCHMKFSCWRLTCKSTQLISNTYSISLG